MKTGPGDEAKILPCAAGALELNFQRGPKTHSRKSREPLVKLLRADLASSLAKRTLSFMKPLNVHPPKGAVGFFCKTFKSADSLAPSGTFRKTAQSGILQIVTAQL